MTRLLIGVVFVCLACLLVVPTQVQSACLEPSSADYDPGDWDDYEDCLAQQDEDEQRELEEEQDRRREEAEEARQQAEDAYNDAREEGVGENAKDLVDAMQETPAIQLADAAVDVADTVECYEECVDENIETELCSLWGYTCSVWGAYVPTAGVPCLVSHLGCLAYYTAYTVVTTCQDVCS